MKNILLPLLLLISFVSSAQLVEETITFTSGDSLVDVTANTYMDNSNAEFILLCHQAGYSRGEYIETAPIFVGKGYNCMAIDQRSGNAVNGVINETALAASTAGIPQGFTDAIPDIEAAIDKAYELNGERPIYLLGSSYSSSLALIIGKSHPKVKATLAFSPGEYLGNAYDVSEEISSYAKPVFVTSSRSETSKVADLVSGIDANYLTHFKPSVKGVHGSRALWNATNGNDEYWVAVELFLSSSLMTNTFQNTLDLSIHPNPSNGIFNINTSEIIKKIDILDLFGRTIYSIKNTKQIDLSKETKGTYFLKIYTNHAVGTAKVVVK